MARISKDFFGQYQITGVEEDIARAQRDARFQQRMEQAADEMMSITEPPKFLSGPAVYAGSAALTYGMIANRRFRYIAQAVIHFPVSFILMLIFFTIKGVWQLDYSGLSTIDQHSAELTVFFHSLAPAFIGAVIWTWLYVKLRTKPKLRKLREMGR